jgi:hypothetical protein
MHHARRCPFQMSLVGPRAVVGNGGRVAVATRPQMRSRALTFMEDLDGRRCRAHFHQVMHQVVRHAVVVRIKSDVVTGVHVGAGPLAEIKRLGAKRIERRRIQGRELRCSSTFAFAKWSLIDAVAQLAYGLVQFLNGEELSMTQCSDDPTFGQ